MAAYDRFYKGDIAREFARGSQEVGGLHTAEDLANWRVYLEEPVSTNYRGIEVYKLTHWVQGPVMLQTLNILENFDLKSMGYNSARYIHTRVPGDEPGVRGPRLLLRRFALPAGGADPRPAVEGLCARAREAGSRRRQRSRRAAGRSVSVPGRQQSVQGVARHNGTRSNSGPTRRSRISGARPRSPSSIARSGSVRPASKLPTRKAGWCRSRRAAAGYLR